ncbi:MAG: hypothetical protein OZX49_00854 [Immundisolibacter sp.]|nr:hypothetical protein [Immundisolibacter sp.]
MAVADQRLGGHDLDAEFFAQFAGECLFRHFAGLEFPAREFPVTGQVGAGQAAREQDFARAAQHADGDVDRIAAHGQRAEAPAVRCGTRR